MNLYIVKDGILSDEADINIPELISEKNYYFYKKPNKNMIAAVTLLLENSKDIKVTIVSKLPYGNKYAAQETEAWLKWYLPGRYNTKFIPLGTSVVDYFKDEKNTLMSRDAGELLLNQCVGGSIIGYSLPERYGITSLSDNMSITELYAALNNIAGGRYIMSYKNEVGEDGYFRLRVSTDNSLMLTCDIFNNYSKKFDTCYGMTCSSDIMNYDCAEIRISVFQNPVLRNVIKALEDNGIGELYKFSDDKGNIKFYIKFNMDKLRKFDEKSVDRYLQMSDKRPRLYSYKKNEELISKKRGVIR